MFSLRREELIIIGVLALACLVAAFFLLPRNKSRPDWEISLEKEAEIESREVLKTEYLIVHVAGAVIKPGVYSLEKGSRVYDALKAAGGETGKADLGKINLAAPLRDGTQIMIPHSEEYRLADDNVTVGGTININMASQADLETLPGIGPAKARAIIKYRNDEGPFIEKEDLMNVSGIGEKTFATLKDLIRVY